ncbi:MAG: glycoside hydrolase family 95 protein [Firmicutes bacterium]|nr:glycoside hydrolase family 95 protein [Bacillota bacterium]
MISIRKTKTALKFEKSASKWGSLWREGIVTGNGLIGASVLGGIAEDRIMLTHGDLWWQGYAGVLPDVADKLQEVRNKLDDRKPREAEGILSNALINKGYRPKLAVPLPLANLVVKMPITSTVKDYMRVVNMETGEVGVSFKDGSTKYERVIFASRADDMLVMELNRSGSKPIDAHFSFALHDVSQIKTPTGVPSKLPEGVVTKYEKHFMYFGARSDNGTDFGGVTRITYYGGSMEVSPAGITIKGANNILVITRLFVESQREREWKNLKEKLGGVKSNYDKLLKDHTNIHSKLFNAVQIDLDAQDRDQPIEQLLRRAASDDFPLALAEKLWLYGRYLFISSTNPKGRPMSNYGIWCGDYKADDAQAEVNIHLQNLYAQVLAGNLTEFMMPIFNFYETQMSDLKKNAGRLYGCRGIFVPNLHSPGSGLLGTCESQTIHFTGNAAIISRMFYDYYLHTDDKKFLKDRALPFMREAALFYEDFFKVNDSGVYDSSPSLSPYTTPANFIDVTNSKLEVVKSAAIDFVLARELFTNLIEGAKEAKVYANEIAKWEDMLTRIPKTQIADDGTVREFINRGFTDNHDSYYAPHLYGAFPGGEINFTREADITKAVSTSIKRRLSVGTSKLTSTSLATYANVAASVGDGELAYECIDTIAKTSLLNNLWAVRNDWRYSGIGDNNQWSPVRLDANTAITSALQNMFVASTSTHIRILPALPSDFKKGSISGIQTQAGVEVGVEWDKKRGTLYVTLKSRRAKTISLMLPPGTRRIAKGLKTDTFNAQTLTAVIEVPGGKALTLDIR